MFAYLPAPNPKLVNGLDMKAGSATKRKPGTERSDRSTG